MRSWSEAIRDATDQSMILVVLLAAGPPALADPAPAGVGARGRPPGPAQAARGRARPPRPDPLLARSAQHRKLLAKQHVRIHDVPVRNASHEEQPAQSEGLIRS